MLAAFKVAKRNVDTVAQLLNENPAVSHNYVRTHDFNLWFTVTVPKTRNVRKEVSAMAKRAGVQDWLFLPAIKKFKISFQLAMDRSSVRATKALSHPTHGKTKTQSFQVSKPFVREMQKDLPLESRPYLSAARALGWSEAKVVRELRRYIAAGAVRRMAAVLRPRDSGYPANVMAVWAPPEDKKDLLGKAAAAHTQVSHCYERPTFPNWPYSIYTMIHGRSVAECRNVIRRIAGDSGVLLHRELTTVREYKKVRVEYFPAAFRGPAKNRRIT